MRKKTKKRVAWFVKWLAGKTKRLKWDKRPPIGYNFSGTAKESREIVERQWNGRVTPSSPEDDQ